MVTDQFGAGTQSLTPEEFKHTAGRILRIREAMKE